MQNQDTEAAKVTKLPSESSIREIEGQARKILKGLICQPFRSKRFNQILDHAGSLYGLPSASIEAFSPKHRVIALSVKRTGVDALIRKYGIDLNVEKIETKRGWAVTVSAMGQSRSSEDQNLPDTETKTIRRLIGVFTGITLFEEWTAQTQIDQTAGWIKNYVHTHIYENHADVTALADSIGFPEPVPDSDGLFEWLEDMPEPCVARLYNKIKFGGDPEPVAVRCMDEAAIYLENAGVEFAAAYQELLDEVPQ